MKGSIISVIEVMLTGIILILAFYHFFPQYVIRPKWDRVLLAVKVMDTLNTIDNLNRTYEFAINTSNFNSFMGGLLKPEYHGAMVWWKETKDLGGYTEDMEIPYFTEGYKESIVDVEKHPFEYSVDSNTVALWHFNEGTGDVTYDETANDNDGILQGDIDLTGWTDDCMFGSCLEFDGVNDYVNVTGSSSLNFGSTTDFTMEAWIKAKTTQKQYPSIIGRRDPSPYNGYIFFLWSDGRLAVQLNNGTGTNYQSTSGDLRDDNWHHVVATADRDGNLTFYVDGEKKGQYDISGKGNIDSTANMFIGWEERNPTVTYFNGTIDEIRVLNRVLSKDEIRADFLGRYDVYSFTLGLGYPY